MQRRTFFRIMADNLLVNNAFCRALSALVNFCNEHRYFTHKKLKFLKKMPLTKTEQDSVYKNRFIFNSTQQSGVDYK